METLLKTNEFASREETMAGLLIMLQLLLLLGVYLFFKADPFQSSKVSSFVNERSVGTQPYSSRNIVDIMWLCQTNAIFPNEERRCASN